MTNLDHIETIVILMMENRSFDHLLGALSLPEYGGRADIDGLTGRVDGDGFIKNPMYRNYDSTAYSPYYPYIRREDGDMPVDLPHSRKATLEQFGYSKAHGDYLMNRFAASFHDKFPGDVTKRNPAMAIYDPSALTTTRFLAEQFTVCNRWFASLPANTHPNRFMAMCGYSHVDKNSFSWPLHGPNYGLYPDHRFFFDWLDDIGVSWRVYHQGMSFVTLTRPSVLVHDNFRRLATSAPGYATSMERDFDNEDDLPQVIFVEPGYLDDPFERNPNDNHPILAMGPGEDFVASIYRAVTRNPDRWEKTVMVVYYDEHGGFFDHVPPLELATASPRGNRYDPFEVSGARVPAFIVSPWADRGACQSHFDHTSILRFLAEKFTPGQAYSDIVRARHEQPAARLESISSALTRCTPRTEIPVMRQSRGPLAEMPAREPENEAEIAYARLYEFLAEKYPDELMKRYPERADDLRAHTSKAPGGEPPLAA